MEKFIVAFATDDGIHFIDRHFGDAKFFDIYEVSRNQVKKIARVENTSGEEEHHADPKKASNISSLLLSEKVNVAVSKIFGKNIKRIKRKFVCIIEKECDIKTSLQKISNSIQMIENEWLKGEERKHLFL